MERSILIVDDDLASVRFARAVLVRAGFTVFVAFDAESALQMLQIIRPAAILLDVSLPGMDGLELTRTLRSDPHRLPVPIIALSAHALNGDAERGIQAGVDAYLTKPVEIRTMIEKIERLIAARTSS